MYLESIYSSQKSFSKKAEVITEGEETKLKSYSTIVAVKENNTIKVKGWYSKTTAIHEDFLNKNEVGVYKVENASYNDYKDLALELEQIGYELEILN